MGHTRGGVIGNMAGSYDHTQGGGGRAAPARRYAGRRNPKRRAQFIVSRHSQIYKRICKAAPAVAINRSDSS
jgi:hypothetical protein